MCLRGNILKCLAFLTCILQSMPVSCFLIPDGIDNVHTKYGLIRGSMRAIRFDNQNYQVRQFLGIPYAEPPIGDLRYKKPVPISRFSNSQFDAFSVGPDCPGRVLPGYPPQSEDCLKLNIYAPSSLDGSKLTGLPVMVWIHGGGFVIGSGSFYDAGTLSAFTDTIVVTLNYRLGPLGFFTLENDIAPGNYGLWDQHLAIQWVKENIENFGGSAENITIFGESAGSSSVILQMNYPGSKDLFKRAIAESGTINTWSIGIKGEPSQASKRFAERFVCNTTAEDQILSCLRMVDPDNMTKAAQDDFLELTYNEIHPRWVPVFDNSFVISETASMIDHMISSPNNFSIFMETDLMIGINNYDGLLYFDMYRKLINASSVLNMQLTEDEFRLCLRRLAQMYLKEPASELVIDAAFNDYNNWYDPNNVTSRINNLAVMTTDAVVTVPTVLTSAVHAAHATSAAKTFLYEFAASPPQRDPALLVPSVIDGPFTANHADEVPFVFGLTEMFPTRTSAHTKLAKAVMTMWSNFAKTGNPNSPVPLMDSYSGVSWPAYDSSTQKYLQISPEMTSQSVHSYMRAKAVDLWHSLITKLQRLVDSQNEH